MLDHSMYPIGGRQCENNGNIHYSYGHKELPYIRIGIAARDLGHVHAVNSGHDSNRCESKKDQCKSPQGYKSHSLQVGKSIG